MASKHQRVAGGRKKYAEGELEKLKADAVELRKSGANSENIATELGISVSSAKRWTKGIKGVTETQKRAFGKQDIRSYKERQKEDRQRNMLDTSEETSTDGRVLFMPRDAAGLNTQGPEPDSRLATHAAHVLTTWKTDKAEGRLTTVSHLEVHKAAYAVASTFTIWDYSDFLSDRQSWRTVRQFCGVRADDIANTVGVSFASISRWEKAARNPDAQYHRRLHEAYKDMLDQYLLKLEWTLVRHSYLDTLPEDHDPEALLDKDDILIWFGQGRDREDFTIDHIEHLAAIRTLLPAPTWREPSVWNGLLRGYGNQLVTA